MPWIFLLQIFPYFINQSLVSFHKNVRQIDEHFTCKDFTLEDELTHLLTCYFAVCCSAVGRIRWYAFYSLF